MREGAKFLNKKASKFKKTDLLLFGALSYLLPANLSAGGGGEGDGDAAPDISFEATANPVPGVTDNYSNVEANYSYEYTSVNGVTSKGSVSVTTPSTPFFLTWNGERYLHENDFLFGKPNTAFANKKIGLKAYQQGIGGDTYLLNNQLAPNEVGEIKLQIRELEPEESYIDKFELNALDLKANEHFITDGNLEESYVFDTKEVNLSEEQTVTHFHKKTNNFTEAKGLYQSLTPDIDSNSTTLYTDDELVIKVPVSALNKEQDIFILIDSHYRDWSLGNQVPFSNLEKFTIGSLTLGRSVAVTTTGVVLVAAGLALSLDKNEVNKMKSIVSVPYTYADTPRGGGRAGSRSLVVTAGDSTKQTYLQTLFPRYVQASQEVVKIPKEILYSLKENFVAIRIKATKKHKVRAAFVFSGKPVTPKLTPLAIKSAAANDGKDYKALLSQKNSEFLHTIPGSVVDLVIQDVPKRTEHNRRYVLKANGFYTRLSLKAQLKIGRNWLKRLAPEDRALLKRLRLG